MKKYFVVNPGPNPAVELKPGVGTFTIPPDGGKIEVSTKELAESLVVDSMGKLKLEVVEVVEKKVEVKPVLNLKKSEETKPEETK